VIARPSRALDREHIAVATLHLDRPTIATVALGGELIVAGGIVAAVNSASPFGHGSWLAAYLVLVGGVSQVVLSIGALALRSLALFSLETRGRPARVRRAAIAYLLIASLLGASVVVGSAIADAVPGAWL
jgi:hypothetical protein